MDEHLVSSLSQWSLALREAVDHGTWDSSITTQLRKMIGEEAAAAVLATARLHPKAVAKLGEGLWWCTERSLQQATAKRVSELKASWVAGQELVDMCCGIGGDTKAFAETCSKVIAVDSDSNTVEMARENLRLNLDAETAAKVTYVNQLASPNDVSKHQVVHIDPDRRTETTRVTRPEDYSPDWNTVLEIADAAAGALVKLAPAAQLEDDSGFHRCWISLSGTVREQTAICGSVVNSISTAMDVSLTAKSRSALLVRSDGTFSWYVPQKLFAGADATDVPLEYLVDPDSAIRAAGLTETFATDHDLKSLGSAAGFLTGDTPPPASLAISERILWKGSCDDRKLRKTLRQIGCYPQRVKTRGVSQNPNELEKRYRKCGTRPVTLWIGKAGKRQYAVVSEADFEH